MGPPYSVSSSIGRAPVSKTGGCWFESILAGHTNGEEMKHLIARPKTIKLAIEAVNRNNKELKVLRYKDTDGHHFRKHELIEHNEAIAAKLFAMWIESRTGCSV